ncbi:MAG: pyridoxal-phosphate dependent enzyme [Candidatus Acidiferrales bacterium]
MNNRAKTAQLGEGNTPLIRSEWIGRSLGLANLFFKLENCNPSGSYKDRFVAAEVSQLLRMGAKGCLATSSGNAGSSLASYCARYGIPCSIVVNENAPAGKLEQMQAHGAHVFRVRGFITSPSVTAGVFETLSKLAPEKGLALVVSAFRYCPEGMVGVESLAYELLQQVTPRIDHVFIPIGGGGLFSAVCFGFEHAGFKPRPKVHAVQPNGCSTVVATYERGDEEIRPVESTTQISGLSVPYDIDAGLALKLLRECGGTAFGVNDEEVYEAQQLMLSREGIYCEPAAATSLAGLMHALKQGVVGRQENIVCLVTGHGFKDPDSIRRAAARNTAVLIDLGELQDAVLKNISSCA